MPTLGVDISAYKGSLDELVRRWSREALTEEMAALAQYILRRSIEAPIPSGYTRQLEESGHVDKQPDQGVVYFGYNRRYAAFQDSGHLPGVSQRIVTPNPPKKWLYIPLNRAGARHTLGANPKDEGLVRGRDYILAKRVVIPVKAYGSPVGPNKYFSQTFKDHVDWFWKQLGASLQKDLAGVGVKFKAGRR